MRKNKLTSASQLSYTNVDGQDVLNLLPDNKDRVVCLVDFATMQRIINRLDKGNMYSISRALIDKLQMANSMEEYVSILKDEIAFHETVNLVEAIEISVIEEEIAQADNY